MRSDTNKKSPALLAGGQGSGKNYARTRIIIPDYNKPADRIQTDERGFPAMQGDALAVVESQVEAGRDVFSVWESRLVRQGMRDEMAEFLGNFAEWKSFWTLTFDQERTQDVSKALFLWLVRELNKELFGKRYLDKVGHSYFQYVAGFERQTRGAWHLHVLADQPVNFDKIHSIWGKRCGFAWIDGNIRNHDAVNRYVCKYVLKGGDLEIYKRPRPFYPPENKPVWWKDSGNNLSRVDQECFSPGQLAQPLTGGYVMDLQEETG